MKADKSKSTILVISMGFLALHVMFSWKWAALLSLAIGVVGIVSSFLSKHIEWGWTKVADILGYVMSSILLSVVFVIFLFPISLFSRLFTKDPLMLSRKHRSYFIDVKKEITKDSLEKMW